jgi:hypothetical protein
VTYADDLVSLGNEEAVLLGMIGRVTEIGQCYGMEMNVEKNQGYENLKATNRPQYRL